MSLVATIYRIPEETFQRLADWDWQQASGSEEFISSFMGLEYLLSRDAGEEAVKLYAQIFNPTLFVGPPDWQALSFDAQMALYEERKMIFYLDPAHIRTIDQLLENVTPQHFRNKYAAEELNDNDIYPNVWHNGEQPDAAFNLTHLINDLVKLKRIFRAAAAEGDYMVVYTG